MKRSIAITIALFLAVPAGAAEELQLGWRSVIEYDSELTSADGGRDDVIVKFGPEWKLRGERRRLRYNLEQFIGYEKYFDIDVLDDWETEISGRVTYDVTPRIRFSVNESFTRLTTQRSGNNNELDPDSPGFDPDFVPDDDLNIDAGVTLSNSVGATLTTIPFPRFTTTSRFSHVFRQSENPTLNSQDTSAYTINNQVAYRWTEAHSFGAGFTYSERDFENGIDDTTTTSFQGFATWNWAIDDRSTFSARVGPAWSGDDPIELPQPDLARHPQDADGALIDWETCPTIATPLGSVFALLPGCGVFDQRPITPADQVVLEASGPLDIDLQTFDAEETDVNVFYSFSLNRNWDRLNASLVWSRSDSQTQSLGATSVVDSVLLRAGYEISPRLRLTGTFRFTRRVSEREQEVNILLFRTADIFFPGIGIFASEILTAVPVDTSFVQTRDSYNFRVRLNRDWGRYSSSFVGFNFRMQENEFDSELDNLDRVLKTDSWQVLMGFTYRFKPIRF